MNYDAFFSEVTCQPYGPFDYQRRLAGSDWPWVLNIPTGLGKTAAVIVAWLYKRLVLGDLQTPRRLVFCLPMRVLVEQTANCAQNWAAKSAGLTGQVAPPIHVLMGGSDTIRKADWTERPETNAIIIGTQDMLLSRALMRGYAMSRYQWPVHFALLHNDALWVFDEVQLMGPGLPTSVQLHAFRQSLGTAKHSRSLWMSATFKAEWMKTVDFDPALLPMPFGLTDEEKNAPAVSKRRQSIKSLQACDIRLTAGKSAKAGEEKGAKLGKQDIETYLRTLADKVLAQPRDSTVILVILNTVERAQYLFQLIDEHFAPRTSKGGEKNVDIASSPLDAPDRILIHSRFRAGDRKAHEARLRAPVPAAGRIIVATQAIEAGVDLSSRVLFTELAPYASMVQRFGRCNRYGEFNESGDAKVLWLDIADPIPYRTDELNDARRQLVALTSAAPADLPPVATDAPLHPVLRRKDFLDLFNTDPDLSGFDIDVAPYIRDADDADVFLFWRQMDADVQEQPPASNPEFCRAGLGAAKKLLDRLDVGDAWVWDTLAREWKSVPRTQRLRPGMIILLNANAGGYSNRLGLVWELKEEVPIIADGDADASSDEAFDGDSRSINMSSFRQAQKPVTLPTHLADVERHARRLSEALGMPEDEAVIRAARWHDTGKAHPAFQNMLRAAHQQSTDQPLGEGFWAKSGRIAGRRAVQPTYETVPGDMTSRRPRFRHELASALVWLALRGDGPQADLVAYLIAAHHGKVRMSLRAMPEEKEAPDGRLFARGIWDGDTLPGLTFADGETVPTTMLHLDLMRLGEGRQGASWITRTQRLLREHGPFQLAWLESLVRIADWRATREEQQ